MASGSELKRKIHINVGGGVRLIADSLLACAPQACLSPNRRGGNPRRRKEAGLTQEKLAEKAGLHHNFIGEIERSNQDLSLSSLVKIAKALNVRVRDLVANV